MSLLAFIINFFLPGKWNKYRVGFHNSHTYQLHFIGIHIAVHGTANHLAQPYKTLCPPPKQNPLYVGILLNNLSVLMLLLVNLIALPVHIYSSLMKNDGKLHRYFVFQLFLFQYAGPVDNLAVLTSLTGRFFIPPAYRLLAHPPQGNPGQ